MIKKLGLKKFLLVLFSCLAILTTILTLTAVNITGNILTDLSENTKTTVSTLDRFLAQTTHLTSLHGRVATLLTQKDPDKLETEVLEIGKLLKEVDEDLKACTLNCDQYINFYSEYKTKADDLINKKILLGKNAEAIEFFIEKLSPIYQNILTETTKINEKTKENTSIFFQQINKDTKFLKITILLSGLFVIFALIIGGFYFSKIMISILSGISSKLNESTGLLNQTSSKVAESSDFLSEATTEQSASIESTSQAVEEITSMIEITKSNIESSAESAKGTNQKIATGKNTIQTMISSIDNISMCNQQTVAQLESNDKELKEMVELIKEIDEKTKVINDIVFQTKLLSFNASVEAARAGEQGKGFAVVAEEVSNLAAMSGQAATQISQLLNNSVNKVNEIVQNSRDSMKIIIESNNAAISDGKVSVEGFSRIFEQINDEATKIFSYLEEIKSGISEQAKGIEEVNKSMIQLNLVAKKNENISQDSYRVSNQLKDESKSLKEITEDLTIILDGRK